MKGKIDRGGLLWLERGGIEKYVVCPFCNDKDGDCPSPCGDWCALFGEPTNYTQDVVTLSLCHQKLLQFPITQFVDERKGEFGKETHGQTDERVVA